MIVQSAHSHFSIPMQKKTGQVDQSAQRNDFGKMLKNAINEVNEAQLNSSKATEKLITGQDIELHEVMIAAQKASITLQAALEVRNKAVEAYQEMMRMQI